MQASRGKNCSKLQISRRLAFVWSVVCRVASRWQWLRWLTPVEDYPSAHGSWRRPVGDPAICCRAVITTIRGSERETRGDERKHFRFEEAPFRCHGIRLRLGFRSFWWNRPVLYSEAYTPTRAYDFAVSNWSVSFPYLPNSHLIVLYIVVSNKWDYHSLT